MTRSNKFAMPIPAEPAPTIAIRWSRIDWPVTFDYDKSVNVVEAGVRQDFLDPAALRPAKKQATRIMPIMAEGLASLTARRRVDEREHLLQVLGQHRVKKRLVRILQSAQED